MAKEEKPQFDHRKAGVYQLPLQAPKAEEEKPQPPPKKKQKEEVK